MQREEMVEENSGKGNNHCKGAEAEKNMTHLRNKRETNVARENGGGYEFQEVCRGQIRQTLFRQWQRF